MYCWYENDPEYLQTEIESMKRFFSQFELRKLSDGRLSWIGTVRPTTVRKNAVWMLQLVYDNNHPSKNDHWGSIRVYVIKPNIDEWKINGGLPHLMKDNHGFFINTVTLNAVSTSAASSLAHAIKWICVFELWLAGDITTNEFREHIF